MSFGKNEVIKVDFAKARDYTIAVTINEHNINITCHPQVSVNSFEKVVGSKPREGVIKRAVVVIKLNGTTSHNSHYSHNIHSGMLRSVRYCVIMLLGICKEISPPAKKHKTPRIKQNSTVCEQNIQFNIVRYDGHITDVQSTKIYMVLL